MHDLADGPAVAGSQFVDDLEVLGPKIQLELNSDFQSAELTGQVMTGGRLRGCWFTLEHEALDILPFQCLGLEPRTFLGHFFGSNVARGVGGGRGLKGLSWGFMGYDEEDSVSLDGRWAVARSAAVMAAVQPCEKDDVGVPG